MSGVNDLILAPEPRDLTVIALCSHLPTIFAMCKVCLMGVPTLLTLLALCKLLRVLAPYVPVLCGENLNPVNEVYSSFKVQMK